MKNGPDNSSQYMLRCLDLAQQGLGAVSPNPLVGAVVVHNGRIIGEGVHEHFGGPHAERNAIDAVTEKELLKHSTLYVNLEPCSHHGKTPPCAELIQTSGIPKVVFGIVDPHPKVSGSGRAWLEQHGISVIGEVEKAACEELNRRFLTNVLRRRPYIVLKWAETQDGYIARKDYTSKWISSEHSRTRVHRWRSEEDAVLVGTMTALKDDPQLNVRACDGRDPARVVIDREGKLPSTSHLCDGTQRTFVISEEQPPTTCEWISWPATSESFWSTIFTDLLSKNIGSVLVEGGAATINSLVEANLWDEARVFYSETTFESGIPAPVLQRHREIARESIKNDVFATFRNERTEVVS